jgi:hypothetical protein
MLQIGGKRGYVPKEFLREQRILHSNLKFEVPTEFGDETDVKENTVEAEPIENFGGKSETPFAPTPLPDAAEELQGLFFFLQTSAKQCLKILSSCFRKRPKFDSS